MNIENIVAIVLASFASGGLVGYIVKIFLERTIDSRFKLLESKQNLIWQNEIDYRKAQIEELYGPIYSMLKINTKIYRLWIDNLIVEANLEIKKHFESNNNEIRSILMYKIHLVDGDEVPPEFTDFMTSAMIWNWYCAKDSEASFPPHIEKLPEIKWPKAFEEYIYSKTEELKKRLDELYKKNRLQ